MNHYQSEDELFCGNEADRLFCGIDEDTDFTSQDIEEEEEELEESN